MSIISEEYFYAHDFDYDEQHGAQDDNCESERKNRAEEHRGQRIERGWHGESVQCSLDRREDLFEESGNFFGG